MKKNCLLIMTAFIVCGHLYAQKTYWSPEQMLKMKNISSVVVSPDGKRVAYTVRQALMTDEKSEYINHIYLSNIDGTNTIQLTRGEKNNTNPKWSPDNKWIAFTSNRDGKNNLYILPVAGGESEKLTDVKTGVNNFKWSPNGQMIAYTMTDNPSDVEEKNKKAKNDWYFMDEDYKQGRLYVLWLNEKDTVGKQKMLQLTKDNRHISSFDWSPDNQSIVYSHAVSSRVNDNVYSDIALVNIQSGAIRNLANTPAGESDPMFSPDGKWIAYESTEDPVVWAGKAYITVIPAGGGKAVKLAGTPEENGTLMGWSADGKFLYYSEPSHTLSRLYKVGVDGKTVIEWPTSTKELVQPVSLNTTGTHFGLLIQSPTKPGDAYISSTTAYHPIRITNANPEIASYPLPKTEVISWKAADGKTIEGLLTYPLNFDPKKKYPLLLNVHGGPAGVFVQNFIAGNSGAYPIAAFAEKGYFILRANPRGSSGYGTDFRLANQRDWGGADYEDLMAGVDHVLAMGMIDKNKLGVMGWSYGGFMSSWIVGHTDRFRAASIGAPVVDLAAQNMTDDIAGFLPSYMKKQPWEDWDVYETHSPLRYVGNVKTPVLLQHGEADIRVPFSQGVMFYNALKRRGVPVRFLVLPRQPHGPTEPRMVLKVMQTNLAWMDQYVLGKEKAF